MIKKFILMSGLFSGLFFLMVSQTRELKYLLCPEMTDVCLGIFDYASAFFLLAPVVFALSLAATFLNERYVNLWVKSTGIFSAFYFLAIFLIPEDRGGGIMNVFPDVRVVTLVSIIILYFATSVIYFSVVTISDFRNKK